MQRVAASREPERFLASREGAEFVQALGQLFLVARILEAAMDAHVPRHLWPPAFEDSLHRCGLAWEEGKLTFPFPALLNSHCNPGSRSVLDCQPSDMLRVVKGAKLGESREALNGHSRVVCPVLCQYVFMTIMCACHETTNAVLLEHQAVDVLKPDNP